MKAGLNWCSWWERYEWIPTIGAALERPERWSRVAASWCDVVEIRTEALDEVWLEAFGAVPMVRSHVTVDPTYGDAVRMLLDGKRCNES